MERSWGHLRSAEEQQYTVDFTTGLRKECFVTETKISSKSGQQLNELSMSPEFSGMEGGHRLL